MTDLDEHDTFHLRGGRVECAECDWWVPEGMEYLIHDHECE